MLPRHHKLSSSADFKATIKGGARAGSATVIVHVRDRTTESSDQDPAIIPGPRFGLVVSKAVGNAVVRHRVSRRLRHVVRTGVDKLPTNLDIVIRALPRAAEASSDILSRDIERAVTKARAKKRA